MTKYTNKSKEMRKIEFEDKTYFLKRGQSVESDKKLIKKADGIISDDVVFEVTHSQVIHVEQPTETVSTEEKPVPAKKKRKPRVKKDTNKEETSTDKE